MGGRRYESEFMNRELTESFQKEARATPPQHRAALVRKATGMEHVPDAIWEALAKQWAKSHVPGLERVAKSRGDRRIRARPGF